MNRAKISQAEQLAARAQTLELQHLNRPKGAPLWNEYAVTCPTCLRSFPPATTRIVKIDGHWHCQHCTTITPGTTGRTQGNALTSDQRQNLDQIECATCHKPFGTRRAVINVNGHHVHYRCPKNPRRRETTTPGPRKS